MTTFDRWAETYNLRPQLSKLDTVENLVTFTTEEKFEFYSVWNTTLFTFQFRERLLNTIT